MAPNLRKRSRTTDNAINGLQKSPRNKTKRQKKDAEHSEPEPGESAEIFHTVFDLIDARANDPAVKAEPILYYPSSGTEYIGYSPKEIYDLANKAAAYYNEIIPPARESSNSLPLVVALLGRSTLDYFVTLLGVSRLGHTLLFLSPRISEEAHLSLLDVTKASALLADDASQGTCSKLKFQLPDLKVAKIVSRSEYLGLSPFESKGILDSAKEANNNAWIIHSSGSTALPKPTWISHSSALGNFKSAFNLVSFVTLPLFHAQGIGWLFRGIMNKKAVYLYPGELPLTSTHLVKTLREHPDIQILLAVPYVCRLLASSDEGVELCKRLEFMFSGGAICPKPIGDKLVQAGVNLVSHFGSTETGQLMNSFRPKSEILEWDWLQPFENASPFIRWEPYDKQNRIFELIVLEGWPAKVTSNREDGAYATADLWERHSDYPLVKKWRYHARKDDTIALVNGEKANPILFEQLAAESSLVQEAIVFGSGKAKLGIFVIPNDADRTEQEVREVVWHAVERGNVSMPAHAQLDQDMIRVLPIEQAELIRRTDKGNIIRSAFYADFAAAIDSAYEELASNKKIKMSLEELLAFLRSEISSSLSVEQQRVLADDTDLFSLGIDSLQATRIRSAIIKRGIDTGEEVIGENIVFEYPSVASLAEELMRMQAGEPATQHTIEDRMHVLIDKYSSAFETDQEPHKSNSANTIVVTGATGSLGAHLVSLISFRDDIEHVVCLVRSTSNGDALARIRQSLTERKADAQWEKITAFASDFSDERLGLSHETYGAIARNLKCIVHSAWAVNFNMSLESFEKDCIKGTRHLIDLCLRARTSKPAEFIFCSSISAAANETAREIPEDLPSSLKAAQRIGYAQSKLIAEHICQAASKATGMDTKILRIGQVAGDTKYGIWNTNEAVPMILKSASTIGSLPMLDEWCSWLPVDAVASTVSDITFTDQAQSGVFNIVNPKSFHWTWDLLLLLREMGIQFKAEDRLEWVKRLRSIPDPVKNPPYKLLDFFETKYGGEVQTKAAVFATEKTQAVSPRFKQLPALDRGMVYGAIRHILGN